MTYLWIFLGGGLGASLRYFISITSNKVWPSFPAGTVLANLLGTFLMGFIAVVLSEKGLLQSALRPFVLVGFLGGLTTFSTFTHESFMLVKNKELDFFFLYLSLNLLAGYLALVLGRLSARVFS